MRTIAKILAAVFVLCLVFTLTACKKNDYYETYAPLIVEWTSALNIYKSTGNPQNGMFSFGFYAGSVSSNAKAYYALYDIDGNGTPELILRKEQDTEDIIAYVFALKDGEPINLFGYHDDKSPSDMVGLPREVPWSRVGSSLILDNGLIDCYDGDNAIYKISGNGYSVVKLASSQPHDYSDGAGKAEIDWTSID
jgi:hypothetical protein